jgi:hypothetical protein
VVIKNESGANSFPLTPQKWVKGTGAIEIISLLKRDLKSLK